MALNSTNKRLALITKHHVLKFFDIKDNAPTVVPNFEVSFTLSSFTQNYWVEQKVLPAKSYHDFFSKKSRA